MTDALADLARDVVRVLDLQREYFRTRDSRLLGECKRAEAKLRLRCHDAIHGPAAEKPSLPGME